MQRFEGLIARTRRPAIPALKTGRMGSRHDVDEAQADRERQQRKLDRHGSVNALAPQRIAAQSAAARWYRLEGAQEGKTGGPAGGRRFWQVAGARSVPGPRLRVPVAWPLAA